MVELGSQVMAGQACAGAGDSAGDLAGRAEMMAMDVNHGGEGLHAKRDEEARWSVMSRRAFVAASLATAAAMVGAGASRMSSAQREGAPGGTPVTGSPVASPAVATQEIEIAAVNGLRFSPSSVSIPAHVPVRIAFTNRTAGYHDLVIPTLGRRSPRIGPDETHEILVRAEPGSYRFYCSIPSHTQAGMEGVIIAT